MLTIFNISYVDWKFLSDISNLSLFILLRYYVIDYLLDYSRILFQRCFALQKNYYWKWHKSILCYLIILGCNIHRHTCDNNDFTCLVLHEERNPSIVLMDKLYIRKVFTFSTGRKRLYKLQFSSSNCEMP